MLIEKQIRSFKMLLDDQEPGISANLLKDGTWEGIAPTTLEHLIRVGEVCLDIGSCIGFYALLMASKGAIVHAIEPVPSNVKVIHRNVEINGYDDFVHIHPYAISDKEGLAPFILSKRCDRGRISPEGDIMVKTISLDSFVENNNIDAIDLLRFDIEGSEVELVKGGGKTLSSMREGSWIFCDIHPTKRSEEEIKRMVLKLYDYGFRPKKILAPPSVSRAGLRFPVAISKSKGFPKVFFQKKG